MVVIIPSVVFSGRAFVVIAWRLRVCRFVCLVIRQYRHHALVGLVIGRSLDVTNVSYFFFLKELTF